MSRTALLSMAARLTALIEFDADGGLRFGRRRRYERSEDIVQLRHHHDVVHDNPAAGELVVRKNA